MVLFFSHQNPQWSRPTLPDLTTTELDNLLNLLRTSCCSHHEEVLRHATSLLMLCLKWH